MDDEQEKRYSKKTLEVSGSGTESDKGRGSVKEKAAVEEKGGGGGSIMKLKLQSSGELRGEETVREPRICNVCGREFSSGKALGGHMRVHIQESRKEEELLSKLKTGRKIRKPLAGKGNGNGSAPRTNNADDTTCYLCGKNFPSRKSLFGHMRCHPNRLWKGIQPPPPTADPDAAIAVAVAVITSTKTSSSSTLSELLADHEFEFDTATTPKPVTDLQKSLSGSGWSVTNRRGRKSFVSGDCDGGGTDEDDADAAYNLLLLYRGDLLHLEEVQQEKELEGVKEECESNSPTNNKAEIEEEKNKHHEESTAGSKKTTKKREIEEKSSLAQYLSNFNPPLTKLKIEGMVDCSKEGNIKAVMETNTGFDLGLLLPKVYCPNNRQEEAGNQNDDESDNSKNTSAGSGGGGVNSNSKKKKKKKRRKMKLIDLEETVGGAVVGADIGQVNQIQAQQRQQQQAPTTPDRYRCSTCNKSFPTHQALGGHRSSHNKFKNSQVMDIDFACASAADAIDEHLYGFILSPNLNISPQQVHEAQGCNIGGVGGSSGGGGGAPSAIVTATACSASMLSSSTITHQCKCCNKTFPTGQALGGHMRCHWNGPSEAQSIQVTSPGEASQTAGSRPLLGFDLNEFPAMDEDGDDEHTDQFAILAAGDASSSHTIPLTS